MHDALKLFRDAIYAAGLEPPNLIEPGKLHRFPGMRKSSSNRAGWCLLFGDEHGGCFGDWSNGFSSHWFLKNGSALSSEELADRSRKVEAARHNIRLLQLANHEDAANRARKIWEKSSNATAEHSYLLSKRINPNSARVYKGQLVLPVSDIDGMITSLQFISSDGKKNLLRGGRKRGSFIVVSGDEEHAKRVIICEGWATGCTLAVHEPDALVLAAIDAGNLETVAISARLRWPSVEIVIAGDDDRLTTGNPGASKAKAAAIASGALLALPQWPGNAPEHLTDFNDLAVWLAGGGV